MGLITHQNEFTISVPPLRLFKAMVTDSQNIIPKVLPNIVKSVDNIIGCGSKPGDVQRMIFFQEDRLDNVKRIDVVDQDNLFYSYTLLEGDFKVNLSDKIKKICYEYKLEALSGSNNGSTIIKNTVKYHFVDDHDIVEINDEKFDEAKKKASSLFSLIEAYLNQHPNFYD